jgi:uncharacterized OB-fold protein
VNQALPRVMAVEPLRLEDDRYVAAPERLTGRSRPVATPETAAFWGGLRDGRLILQRCHACGRYTHPPVGGCQWCGGPTVPSEVPADATVNTFAICYLQFGEGLDTPYIGAIVNPLVEPELQIATNIVNCRISDVRCALPVSPAFVTDGELTLLFYTPAHENGDPT